MQFTSLLALAGIAAAAPAQPPQAQDDGVTAPQTFGWANIVQQDNFDGTALGPAWKPYDGPGHANQGIRSPAAITVANSILTITGDDKGTTGGMEWANGVIGGRWEARARYTAGTSAYHCVLILWPDADDWPIGTEIDYSEVGDGTRQNMEFWLHLGADDQKETNTTTLDMTQWQNYAVEWTPQHIVGFVNAKEVFRSENPAAQPPRPMHATIQLDWFPEDGPPGPGKMEVDWIRQYSL